MEPSDEPQPQGRKRVGRPRVEKKAEPLTRTMRVPLQAYDDITTYIKRLEKRTGRTIDRSDLIANAVTDWLRKDETVKWPFITGKRRLILLTLIGFLAETPEGRPEAQLVDAMLASLALAVQFGKKLKRALRLLEEAR